jgi:hypothetical protein
MIYSPPSYSMGADEAISVPASAEVDPARAKAELSAMKSSLKKWLSWRKKSDSVAEGKIKPKKGRAIGHLKQKWRAERLCGEQAMADKLYHLLSQVFDPAALPEADVAKDPDAAVKLAVIAVSGKLPTEATQPEEQGFIWMWPLVLVLGVVGFVLTSKIRAEAEIEMEKERTRCIQEAGWFACDELALVKVGAIGIGAFFIYSKFFRKKG